MKLKRIAAALLSLMLLFGVSGGLLPVNAEESWVLDTLKEEIYSYKPIPLLLVKINYDADKDGKDGYANGVSAEKMKENGEQWTHSADNYWSELCFSDKGKSLKNYYKDVSNGTFWFTPVPETSGTENDGVVTVTIPYKHPYAATKSDSTEDSASRIAALSAASEFVDFAALDVNGDGTVSGTELAVVYICGGYESSSGKSNARDQFGVHGHKTSGSGVKLDGVQISQAAFVRIGEHVSFENCQTVGIFAHELGHYLGADDLYDTGTSGQKWNYSTDLTLMASGNYNAFSGERSGTSPSYFDPYHLIALGFAKAEVVGDGTYTLYSRQSQNGDYNVLKIPTPNPDEYYLVENRYGVSGGQNFDAMTNAIRGILIWHIDENAVRRGHINNQSSGHDPGIIAMGVNITNGPGLNAPYFFYRNANANERFSAFDSGRYRFPVSGMSYTSLTEEQAAAYGLHIDILSPEGFEMEIKVTGAATLPPTFSVASIDATTSTLSFRGVIKDLCGGNVTGCGMILSEEADYKSDPNAKTVVLRPDEYGKFTATFEGLQENTKYYCTAYVEGSAGRGERTVAGYTKATPVPRDYYIAYIYLGKSSAERSPYSQKLKPGDYISDGLVKSMKKSGYLFGGFCLDDGLTERFDLRSTQTEISDFTLFAKWIDAELAATLTVHNATLRYGMTFATRIGETYQEPYILPREGYIFEGWYTDEELTLPFDFGMAAETTDTVHLYAKWEKDKTIPEATTPPAATTAATTPAVTTAGTENTETTGTTVTPPSEANSAVGIIVAVSVAAVLVGGGIYLYFKSKKQKSSVSDHEAEAQTETQNEEGDQQ